MSLYYLQTNLICICILLVIYLTIRNRSGALPARRRAFNRLLLIIAVICVTDVVAWYFSGLMIPGARAIIQISNIIYFAAITWAGYAWLQYVELRIRSFDYEKDRYKLLKAVPLIIMVLILVTNPLTNFVFSIDANNTYSRGPGVFIHWIISWFYLVYATVKVIIRTRHSTSRAEREQFIPMIWFIVPPALAAVFQMVMYGVTSTQCGMTLAALIIAINFMVDEVSKDMLTGLNNRRALEMTIIERLQKANSQLTILMCDIDKFKSINDTLGHSAGDLVLRRMAEALKRVCADEDRGLFLCRYGGDEFIVCGSDLEKEDITRLTAKIEANIEAVNREYGNTLNFGISVGDATGICATYQDVEALISMADGIMYERKNAKKQMSQ